MNRSYRSSLLLLTQRCQICSEVLLRFLGRQQRDDLLHIGLSPPLGYCIKIGLPGKSILRDCFQENRSSWKPISYWESVFGEDLFLYNSSLLNLSMVGCLIRVLVIALASGCVWSSSPTISLHLCEEEECCQYCRHWNSLQGWAKEMELSWEKVSAWLQPASAGHTRQVLKKTVLFSAQLCTLYSAIHPVCRNVLLWFSLKVARACFGIW